MLTNFIKGIFKICTCVFYKLFWEEEPEEEFPDNEGFLSLLGKIISPFLLFYFMYNYSISNASRYRRRRSRRSRRQMEAEFTDSEDEDSIASEFNDQESPEMDDRMEHENNNQGRISYATMPDLRRSKSYTRSECNFTTDNSIEFRFNNIENFNRTVSPLGYSRSYDNLTPPLDDTNSTANSAQRSHNLFTVNEENERSDDSSGRNSAAHSRSFRKRLTKHTLTTSVNEIKRTRTGTVYGRQHYL